MLKREGGLLRYQVLLTLFALDVLGLVARHVNICGIGAVVQEVVEWVQVILLRGKREREGRGGKRGRLFNTGITVSSTLYKACK